MFVPLVCSCDSKELQCRGRAGVFSVVGGGVWEWLSGVFDAEDDLEWMLGSRVHLKWTGNAAKSKARHSLCHRGVCPTVGACPVQTPVDCKGSCAGVQAWPAGLPGPSAAAWLKQTKPRWAAQPTWKRVKQIVKTYMDRQQKSLIYLRPIYLGTVLPTTASLPPSRSFLVELISQFLM